MRERFLAYDQWLATTPEVPKLLLTTQPGSLASPQIVAWCRANIASLQIQDVGPAGHHAPEDQPDTIGRAIAGWLAHQRLTATQG